MKTALINAMMVGSGGFLGALARYGLSGLVHRLLPLTTFPYGTLAVNLVGCLLIGVVAGLAESRQLFGPELRTFALIGVLGGFPQAEITGMALVVGDLHPSAREHVIQ